MPTDPRLVEVTALEGVAAAAWPWRRGPSLFVTVAAKATFAIVPDGVCAHVDPDPLVAAPVHHDGLPSQSVRLTTDMVPFLLRAEVLLTGHAYAPPGQAVPTLATRLVVRHASGEVAIDKALVVHGKRGPRGEIEPFARAPLRYEHALGGIGFVDNPYGVGARPADPDRPRVIDPRDPRGVAGYAPRAAGLAARRKLLGGADARAMALRVDRVAELPEAVDLAYFNAAPPDQQLDRLDGDERLMLDGLHPDVPRLWTALPGARVIARIQGLDPTGAVYELPLFADVLRIDSDAQRASIVHRGNFPVAAEAELRGVSVVVGVERGGRAIAWPDPRSAGAGSRRVISEMPGTTGTIDLGPLARGRTLPFLRRSSVPVRPVVGTVVLSDRDAEALAAKAVAPFAVADPGADHGNRAIEATPFAGAPIERAPVAIGFETMAITPPSGDATTSAGAEPVFDAAARFFHRLPAVEAPAGAPEPVEIVAPRPQEALPVLPRGLFSCCTLPWRAQPSEARRVVVVKGTFDLVPGGPATEAEEQRILSGDVFEGDDPAGALLRPTDFDPVKPRVDVIVVGHARPAGGRPARAMDVTLRFGRGPGAIDRTVRVFGDRRWVKDATGAIVPSAPEPFERMRMTRDRAFGGPGDPRNRCGVGHDGLSASGEARLPNLEEPACPVRTPRDTPEPACLGPVSATHAERARLLGTYDRAWLAERWPWMPADFDPRHYQAAQPAQQAAEARGDEPYSVAGMDPDHPMFAGELPGVRVACFAQRTTEAGGALVEVPLRIDTVTLDLDARTLELVWRGSIACADDDASDLVDVMVVRERVDGPRTTVAEARAQRAAIVGVALVPAAADGPVPANDATPTAPADPGAAVAARLGAVGLPGATATGEVDAPALPAPDADRVAALRVVLEAGAPLDDLDLSGLDLSGADLRGRSFARAVMRDTRLRGAALDGAVLRGAVLAGADLDGARLVGADLTGADLAGARLAGADLGRARLDDADLTGAEARGADLTEASAERATLAGGAWDEARFVRAVLRGADLTGAHLDRVVFDEAVLDGARLYDAEGARASFVGASLADARADGAMLEGAALRQVKAPRSVWARGRLDRASFAQANLDAASFERASMRGAFLGGATLVEARLARADLEGAELVGADLRQATLTATVLDRADLRASSLYACDTWKARLAGADLDGADVTRSSLAGGRS